MKQKLKIQPIFLIKLTATGGGAAKPEVAYLLLTQQPWVRYSVFPRIFLLMLLRFIDSIALNIGQMLEFVN